MLITLPNDDVFEIQLVPLENVNISLQVLSTKPEPNMHQLDLPALPKKLPILLI